MKIENYLLTLQSIFFYILIFFGLYQTFICLFAFTKETKKKITNKQHKFMAVIAARNESNVIGALIKSIKEQEYKDVDIYVIADNCTDNTADIARKNNVFVYERFNNKKRSKGYALEWFFNKILVEIPNKYDAFSIFDADNIVSKDFFQKMNEKLCQGAKIIQGYRDIKNPGDNWITSCYAIFYWTMNRYYHYSRYKIGLSPLINGTGFTVAMSVLKENFGWHSRTLTEDIEFSIENIFKGHTIAWAHDAIVYDEQPQTFKQSCRQRLRWSVGHMQCFRKFSNNSFKIKNITATTIDAIIYILGVPMILLPIAITLIDISKIFFHNYSFHTVGIKSSIIAIILTMLQALIIPLLERKNIKNFWKGIATYPLFLLSWFVINMVSCFKMNLEWKPIIHTRQNKTF